MTFAQHIELWKFKILKKRTPHGTLGDEFATSKIQCQIIENIEQTFDRGL